ncbi:MAG: thiamine pyrophosphate-dependent enzyme [Acidimicrobiia bacterium]
MTALDATVTFRNDREYPFCPGCGHESILDAVNSALVLRGTAPSQVVIVSDIGCAGLSDQYFATSAFHGLHGRSITYATGIKLARPDLDVLVLMGDGGAGIGGTHLINAARRNIGVTVVVFNNLNFGMTGGQHSVTTPLQAITSTTPAGNLERPLDVCGTVAVNGASHVWRGTSFDTDLAEIMATAMDCNGFALLDVWELCSAYFVRNNRFGKRSIDRTIDELGFDTGVIVHRDLPEYAVALRAAGSRSDDRARWHANGLEPSFRSPLLAPTSLVVAGAAGGRVRSAARLLGRAAISAGLFAAQRDDYPVTVKAGHSISTVVLSPEPIDHTGVAGPDVLVVVAVEGAAKAGAIMQQMDAKAAVYALPEFAPAFPQARLIDPARSPIRLRASDAALAAVSAVAADMDLVPAASLLSAARGEESRYRDRNVDIITAAAGLVSVS